MFIKLNHDDLYVRELTELEKATIGSATCVTPMLICPDLGKIIETGEEVKVTHAFLTVEGLHYGFDTSCGKYSTKNSIEIQLLNPKFNWVHVAKQNEKR